MNQPKILFHSRARSTADAYESSSARVCISSLASLCLVANVRTHSTVSLRFNGYQYKRHEATHEKSYRS